MMFRASAGGLALRGAAVFSTTGQLSSSFRAENRVFESDFPGKSGRLQRNLQWCGWRAAQRSVARPLAAS
jgi:hypothetical protein